MNLPAERRIHVDVILADPRWAAVLARDPAADGRFYYSVASTGVYCRPSCGARRPRPEHVRFHDSCAAAEQAGFRPCRRCRPNMPIAAGPHTEALVRACRQIEESDSVPTLAQLAEQAGLSVWHFHRLFKRHTGVTPKEYGKARRRQRIGSALRRGGSVTEAIYEAGYNSSGRFYEESATVLGMTPTTYRAGGLGMSIRFAIGESSLGSILVAQSERGICAILLGDEPQALVHELEGRFPRAELIGGDGDFEQLVARVVGFVDAPQLGLDLPLDLRGTAFQQRVWQALREIPPGQTISYRELAQRIGAPKAVRAVGAACGANALAVAIPCHRVVRSDGGLAGYRWGVERKRALLLKEQRGQPADPTHSELSSEYRPQNNTR